MLDYKTAPATHSVVVIGIGNLQKRDDGVGLEVARLVKIMAAEWREPVLAFENVKEPFDLMDAWSAAEIAVVCEAVATGAAPGTIYHFDVSSRPLPASLFRHSTDGFNLSDAIELARGFHRLPSRLIVLGIEGSDFGDGEGLTPLVGESAQSVAQSVLAYVFAAPASAKVKV